MPRKKMSARNRPQGSGRRTSPMRLLPKTATGIQGLDEITGGGLPKGRTTLICGSAGCGKTMFAMEFLVRGAQQYDEPGVFVSFEESADDLAQNVASMGFDLKALAARKKLLVDHIRVVRSEIEETGAFDLEGLFIRLGLAIDAIGAKRVVLDTLEALFGGFSTEAILRAEIRRLFEWLKERGVTAIVTGERGEGTLTRHGLEEYVSDCVILLDHRVVNQLTARRLRIVKYRGSLHGTDEYPFLIRANVISVVPITSIGWTIARPAKSSAAAFNAGQGAGRGRILSVKHDPDFRGRGHRQEQYRRTFRGGSRQSPRTIAVYRTRRVPKRDRPQYEVDRHPARAADRQGHVALPRLAAHGARTGNASRGDPRACRRIPAAGRRRRSITSLLSMGSVRK
jgi:KaiC/GvpD/RAD55 family RecA-like ATPase